MKEETQHIIKIATRQGYFSRYMEILSSNENYTYKRAWQELEDELEQYGLDHRYSTYESFYNMFTYHRVHNNLRI